MTIITVTMVKNEEAMIESSVRYWMTFSDVIILFDHFSTDGTPDILRALREENPGRIVLFHPDFSVDASYMQAEITNKMIETAFLQYHADFVIPLDADEFPILSGQTHQTLREFIMSLDQNRVYYTFWLLFGLPENDVIDPSVLAPLSFHEKRRDPLRRFPKYLIPRGVYSEDPVFVTIGNHSVYRPSGNNPARVDLSRYMLYAHYMFRSISHYKVKCAVGWIVNYVKDTHRPGEAEHYRRAVEQILAGELSSETVNFAALTVQGMTMENDPRLAGAT